jgi:hypothetical protein
VESAIAVGAAAKSFAAHRQYTRKISAIAGQSRYAEEAGKFAADAGVFTSARNFDGSAVVAENIEDFLAEADRFTKEADRYAARPDLLAEVAGDFLGGNQKIFRRRQKSAGRRGNGAHVGRQDDRPEQCLNSISGASPNMLHIMFFALIAGIAVTLLPAPVPRLSSR